MRMVVENVKGTTARPHLCSILVYREFSRGDTRVPVKYRYRSESVVFKYMYPVLAGPFAKFGGGCAPGG